MLAHPAQVKVSTQLYFTIIPMVCSCKKKQPVTTKYFSAILSTWVITEHADYCGNYNARIHEHEFQTVFACWLLVNKLIIAAANYSPSK